MKIGMMNNPLKPVADEMTFCHMAGFDFLDLTIEGPCATHVNVIPLRDMLKRYGLTITGHTDPCLPYAYPLQSVRDACLQELERCARIFSSLGAAVMNIHPCYYCPPAMKKDIISFNIEALKPIVAMAASFDLTVVIENYQTPFDRVTTFQQILTSVPGIKMHLDFGHANFGCDHHDVFCRELGSDIRHVHFSDNRSRTDDHMPLGVGNIDWANAVTSLKAFGYDETITLEIFCNHPETQYNCLDMGRRFIQKLWNSSQTSDSAPPSHC